MAVLVKQRTHRLAMSCSTAAHSTAARRHRQHPQLCGNRHQVEIVVGEVSGINRNVGGIRQRLEQLVGQPVLPGHQRRMLGAGQPLPQRHHRFHA